MRHVLLTAAVSLCLAAPAHAETEQGDGQVPHLGYFTGLYELLGRDGGTPAGLVSRIVRIEPEGAGLAIEQCGLPGGRLERYAHRDLPNQLEGQLAGVGLFCSHYNNFDNYAHLVCFAVDGARLSFWPTMQPSETLLDCP